MLERLVENWLTSAGERGYQTPFAQLLAVEGHRVLYGPAHHAFEHGKDLATYDQDGRLCAFQLKGGNLDLRDIEAIQGQLQALAEGAVMYPGVNPPRRPDRALLVVSGTLTPPARDRIQNFNLARHASIPAIEVVEKEQLVSRFVAAHGLYLPTEPSDLSAFLRFFLADGRGPFPVRDYCAFLADVHKPRGPRASRNERARALASSVILTAYAVAPWEREGNHLSAAEAWLTLGFQILRIAATEALPEETWREPFDLAMAAARGRLLSLLEESSSRDDLIVADLVEGMIYPTRALLVCGYLAAFYLSERALGQASDERERMLKEVLLRELSYIRVTGEVAGAYIIAIGTALECLGEREKGRGLVARYASSVTKQNQPRSSDAIADPYHTFEDTLLRTLGADVVSADEQFCGHSYTAHVMIEWLARRGERRFLEAIWPDVTRLQLCETRVSRPERHLAAEDGNAVLAMWQANAPESFERLRRSASVLSEAAIPGELWGNAEYLPYLGLIFPYRLTADLGKALDYLTEGVVTVTSTGGDDRVAEGAPDPPLA